MIKAEDMSDKNLFGPAKIPRFSSTFNYLSD